ncbi:uncharacterized protein PADG_03010 [Paracoccidioides brasiliensis Pb18]|uniref:Uncharacterized protein n=1 Tax=Paracoccidioides brasiliensis (strain Pb18) TaxID=502780 RepID=C1G755_PARBD|nr:uncharacterized protein PADG_03010 [Paracoccidioides brasiliensis Pb18]EEH46912.2 hypothetical protein PADG_03010 [Paracoccidioides brasiliensis Pb18]
MLESAPKLSMLSSQTPLIFAVALPAGTGPNRAPGDVKPSWKWSTALATHPLLGIRNEYRQALSQVNCKNTNRYPRELHRTTNTKTFIKSISASSCLSIMESLDSVAQARRDIEHNIANLDDLYRALLQTRQDIEQNITNLEEPIQRLRDAETIDDIRKYLPDLSPAFRRLSLSFERLAGFTSCALDVKLRKGVEYLQEKMGDVQVVCAESQEQLEEDP